ncbi:unnamed protein product [Nezara viridula]|uniref:Uncharacterized protein n=1 Tax=Nezara viridula TaxID=85310 RepID=A0A9P0MXA9_NEZVI|nr:unnamed protein product [Nezara viridula]
MDQTVYGLVSKRGREEERKDWEKVMKKTCGEASWKRVALERKERKRMERIQLPAERIHLVPYGSADLIGEPHWRVAINIWPAQGIHHPIPQKGQSVLGRGRR